MPTAVASQRPVVGKAPTGVEVVQIAPPSAAGVSHNRYSRFDVTPSGVILNNGTGLSNTSLGVQTAGNVRLVRPARIILNEVVQAAPSTLRGVVEVAGTQAEVIVANPAGITCNGCGFVNADRVLLTSGRTLVPPGGLPSFRVGEGEVAVGPLGLSGQSVEALDIIANTVAVAGPLRANQLGVTAGRGVVSVNAEGIPAFTPVAPRSSTPAGMRAGYSIDVRELGGMYARSIRLLASDAGVMVRKGGELHANAGDLSISAQGALVAGGTVRAERNVTLAAPRIWLEGPVVAGGDLQANAGLEAGLSIDRLIQQQPSGPAALPGAGTLTVNGPIRAKGDVSLAAQRVELLPGASIQAMQSADISWSQSLSAGTSQVTLPGSFAMTFIQSQPFAILPSFSVAEVADPNSLYWFLLNLYPPRSGAAGQSPRNP